jgi:hypothetical protein
MSEVEALPPGAFSEPIPSGMVIDGISNSYMPKKMYDRLQAQRREKALERARNEVFGYGEALKGLEREAHQRAAKVKAVQKQVAQANPSDSPTLIQLCLELRAEVIHRDEVAGQAAGTRGYLEMAEERLAALKAAG